MDSVVVFGLRVFCLCFYECLILFSVVGWQGGYGEVSVFRCIFQCKKNGLSLEYVVAA